ALICAFLAIPSAQAGPLLYGVCQTDCNALAVSCYAATGFTFGTVIATPAVPAVILACNASLGTCSAACVAVTLLAPTLVMCGPGLA
ncbi:hypothetical protein BDZ94DRAFT_1168462, partial [Collybia nuda]